MTARSILPNRRPNETFEFAHGTINFTASVGFDPRHQVAEVFLNCTKQSSGADASARDAAIAVSLALQHGVDLRTLRHAMTRNGDGLASSPIGCLLDLLDGEGVA